MKTAEFCLAIRKIIPVCEFKFDNEGQIIIYTNRIADKEYNLIPLKDE